MGKKIVRQKKVTLTRKDGIKSSINKKKYDNGYEKIFGKK